MSRPRPLAKERFLIVDDVAVSPDSLSISGEISTKNAGSDWDSIGISSRNERWANDSETLENGRRLVRLGDQQYRVNDDDRLILRSFQNQNSSEIYWKTAPNKIKFWIVQDKPNQISVISDQDWNAGQETLYLYSVPGLVEDILKSREEMLDEMFDADEVRWN